MKNATASPAKKTLPFSTLAAYGGGGMFSYGFFNNFLAYNTLFFLTDVAGFPSVVAASMYSAIQLLKIITMTVSGIVIDSTSLKWGKYRSWIAIGCILIVISGGTMFLNLSALETTFYGILFVFLYALCNFGYNLMWSGTRSLVGPMSKSSADGIRLTSAAQVSTTIAGVLYGLISSSLLAFFTEHTSAPYASAGYFYSLIILLGTIVMMRLSKAYDQPRPAQANGAKPQKVSFLEMLKSLKGQGLIFFFAITAGNIQSGFFSALLIYYTTYVLKNPTVLGLAVTVSSIGGFCGGVLAPTICGKIGKRGAYILAHAGNAVLYFCMYLFGNTAVTFLIIRFLIGFSGSFAGASLPALGNDLADYNEMRGASRARAFVQSIIGASIRIGSLISTSIASFGLAALGYVAGTEPSASVLGGITFLMAIGPASVCILCCILIAFYKVNEKELDEYRLRKAQQSEQ